MYLTQSNPIQCILQYAFARFNNLRKEYVWGQRIYEIARANAKDGVNTIEWEESDEAKDLAGFGFDAMYEDLRNDAPYGSRMFDDTDDDDDNGSQDTSGFGSQAGSTKSGTSKGGYQTKRHAEAKEAGAGSGGEAVAGLLTGSCNTKPAEGWSACVTIVA